MFQQIGAGTRKYLTEGDIVAQQSRSRIVDQVPDARLDMVTGA
ncbi:MAG: hypothetical protein OXC68_05900 [Aestuariivita sp.]|nr:hypothetical protein [Aestuariivita sp.]